MKRLVVILAICSFALFAGCGGGGSGGSAPQTQVDTLTAKELEGLKELLTAYARSHKSPPNKPGDIATMEPAFPETVKLSVDVLLNRVR